MWEDGDRKWVEKQRRKRGTPENESDTEKEEA